MAILSSVQPKFSEHQIVASVFYDIRLTIFKNSSYIRYVVVDLQLYTIKCAQRVAYATCQVALRCSTSGV